MQGGQTRFDLCRSNGFIRTALQLIVAGVDDDSYHNRCSCSKEMAGSCIIFLAFSLNLRAGIHGHCDQAKFCYYREQALSSFHFSDWLHNFLTAQLYVFARRSLKLPDVYITVKCQIPKRQGDPFFKYVGQIRTSNIGVWIYWQMLRFHEKLDSLQIIGFAHDRSSLFSRLFTRITSVAIVLQFGTGPMECLLMRRNDMARGSVPGYLSLHLLVRYI